MPVPARQSVNRELGSFRQAIVREIVAPLPRLLGESPKPTFIPGRYDRLEAKGVSTMGSLEAMLLIVGSTLALLYLLVRYPDGRRRTRVRP